MKKSIVFAMLAISMVVALLVTARGNAAPLQQTTTIYFTNFNAGYSDWTASGDVASVATPSIQPNSLQVQYVGRTLRLVHRRGRPERGGAEIESRG